VGYWGFFVLWGVYCILGFSVLWGVTFVSWVIDGVYYCILGFMWVLGVVGFLGFLCGLAELLLCILPVYLGRLTLF
jgi:hypothetical protein